MTNVDHMARCAAAPPSSGVGRPIPFCQQERRAVDVEGRRYTDFVAGIAVVNTGHTATPKGGRRGPGGQIPLFSHTCFRWWPMMATCAWPSGSNALAPGHAPKKTFFLSTGAEAVENAIKIAAPPPAVRVIAFQGGFHGRTLLALGLTGKIEPYKVGVGPFPAEITMRRSLRAVWRERR